MMLRVSDLGPSYCEIRDVVAPSSNNDQVNIGNISKKKHPHSRQEADFSSNDGDDEDKIELPRKKKPKNNNAVTVAYSSSARSCLDAHVAASSLHTDAVYLPQDFTSLDSTKKKCHKKHSPKRIISSVSSREKRFVTFTLAPVDVRHCRLRLPMQFSRENGITKPGKIHLLGYDGSKWLANLLLESRGRMTLGDGWKSFVKANELQIGESYTLELKWEDTTPVLSLCPADDSIKRREGGECSEASEKEPIPILETTSGNNITNDENRNNENIDENKKEESSSLGREKNNVRWRDSTSSCINRFLNLTITPDSLKHGRLRIPLQFMRENSMNTPGDITLLGKDGAKWLVSLLLEKRGRMSLGKGWKEFAKANSLKTGDSITLESIWEDDTPVLRLLESSKDRRQQGECSKAREEKSNVTEPSSGNKTRKAGRHRGESRDYPLTKRDSSLIIQNRLALTSTPSPELVCRLSHDIGEISVFRDGGDLMFQVSDLGPSCSENLDVLAPSSNIDQNNIELPRRKKVKKNNRGTKADSSPDQSCSVAYVTMQYLPQDFTSSDVLKRKCCKKDSPTQIISSYSPSEKQLATFTLAPVDVRNCRLRLPMQFTRENGITKPGKIYLLGKSGSKWLANLLLERRGRMTLGDGWKSFVTANGLKTGESFALKLNWEGTTPVLSLLPAEYSIDNDSREGEECSEASERELLPIEVSSGKEISKDENISEEREANHLIWREPTSPSQNRFLTLTITPDSLRHGRLRLPLQFMRENGMNKPGEITLSGKDGTKWLVSLLLERRGRMSLGKGWKDFAKSNGLKTGDSITLESIWEAATPVLSLLRIRSTSNRSSKDSLSTEPCIGNKTKKAENNREGSISMEVEKKHLPTRRDSSSAIPNRIVILTLTPEDIRDCKLHLPSQFMRTNGIIKPGKVTLLGRSGMKWFAYMLSKDGTVALGNGWKGFCEANGVMVGESFILEFIHREDTNLVLKFCSYFGDQTKYML
ncbi:unnamed protein product [Microthlaspi erraticum]|uniref:TF-B3 domain-containing protein n=1 Tax=Microthlaspi erraticum TaxID=1685480 RepID=A0A6D2J7J0_9BRAS|nr:unnamed protein product [Microthlaspi erraticum]